MESWNRGCCCRCTTNWCSRCRKKSCTRSRRSCATKCRARHSSRFHSSSTSVSARTGSIPSSEQRRTAVSRVCLTPRRDDLRDRWRPLAASAYLARPPHGTPRLNEQGSPARLWRARRTPRRAAATQAVEGSAYGCACRGVALGPRRPVPPAQARERMKLETLGLHRPELRAWAMYDWALSGMQTVIMTAIFPIFFVKVAAVHLPGSSGTQLYARANTVAMLIVAIVSPLLGAITDYKGNKKPFLAFFTVVGASGAAAMFFIQRGD